MKYEPELEIFVDDSIKEWRTGSQLELSFNWRKNNCQLV